MDELRQDGDSQPSVKPKLKKARLGAEHAKAACANEHLSWLVRAEVSGLDTFTIFLEEPKKSWFVEKRSTVIQKLEQAAQLAGGSVQDSLADADHCELHASVYLALHHALVADRCMVVGGTLYWMPLPGWVAEKLPSFGGDDQIYPQPASVWLPEGLMEYQQNAVSRSLVQGGRVLLADEMGLGKTAEALAVVAQYIDREGPALIITPPSLGFVWRNQIKRWLPEYRACEVQTLLNAQQRVLPQARLVIISYTLFISKLKLYSKTPDGHAWKIVVCDEAHCLRNPASQRSKALLPVLHAAKHAVLVTGTPTPKQASEAYTLLHALRPMSCSFKQWCDRYGGGCTERREAEVAALLAEVMVRHTKADVMEQLPPRHRQRVELQLPVSAVSTLRKLQESCTDDEYFKQLARLKEAAAQDYVEYLLDASNEKFVLFGHHRAMLKALEAILVKKGVSCIRIDGSTPVVERAGLVNRFQTDPACRVAVLSVLAAGEGLSFTSAALCVFCELCPAVPGVIEQAEARIYRIGQQASHVDVHFLIVDGTRDDRVFSRLESRTGAVAQAIGDLPTDLGAGQSLLEPTDFGAQAQTEDKQTGWESHPAPQHVRALSAPIRAAPAPVRAVPAPSGAAAAKKKRRKPGFDLGSVLDEEIARAQASLGAPQTAALPQIETGEVNGQTGEVKRKHEPMNPRNGSASDGLHTSAATGFGRTGAGRVRRRVACSSSGDDEKQCVQNVTKTAGVKRASTTRHVPANSDKAEDMALSFFSSSVAKAGTHSKKHKPGEQEAHIAGCVSSELSMASVPETCIYEGGQLDAENNHSQQTLSEGSRSCTGDSAADGVQGMAEANGCKTECSNAASDPTGEDPLSALLDSLIDTARAAF